MSQHSTGLDVRPKTSPYKSDFVQLFFELQGPFYVTRELLSKSVFLHTQLLSNKKRSSEPSHVHVQNISANIGHVVVHFLWTGEYQCLQPQGNTAADKNADEFVTALRVSDASRLCGLPQLETLADAELERVGHKVHVFSLLKILDQTSPRLGMDHKTSQYLGNRIKSLVTDLDISSAVEVLADLDDTGSTSQLVLKTLITMRMSDLAEAKKLEEATSVLRSAKMLAKNHQQRSSEDSDADTLSTGQNAAVNLAHYKAQNGGFDNAGELDVERERQLPLTIPEQDGLGLNEEQEPSPVLRSKKDKKKLKKLKESFKEKEITRQRELQNAQDSLPTKVTDDYQEPLYRFDNGTSNTDAVLSNY